MPNINLRTAGVTPQGPVENVVGADGYSVAQIGSVLAVQPDRTIAPSAAASLLAQLSTVRYVDKNTAVLTAAQTGSISAPFATLHQGIAALAAPGGTLYVVPADYTAEGPLAIPAALVVNILPLEGALPGPSGSATTPDLAIPLLITTDNIALGAGAALVGVALNPGNLTAPSSASSFCFDNCQLSGTVGGAGPTYPNFRVTNSQILGNVTCSEFELDNCEVLANIIADVAVISPAGRNTMRRTAFPGGNVTVRFQTAGVANAGNVTVDNQTLYQWNQTTGNTVTAPGTMTVMLQDSDFASAANLALGVDGLQAFPATLVKNLAPSKIYQVELQFQVGLYTDASHAVNGAVDFTIQASIATDAAAVATVTFNTVPVPNISYLPVGLGGASATVASSAGGFTVSAQRPAGVASHAWFKASYTFQPKDVT